MPDISANTFINLLFLIGCGQISWLFYMLLRRGIAPVYLWQATSPLMAIWVLLWPVYDDTLSMFLPLIFCTALLVLSYASQHKFLAAMRYIWGKPWPLPAASLLLSLAIALYFFQSFHAFGFALGLIICLAFPLADFMDRLPLFHPLGLSQHPQHTLAGHLVLIAATTCLSSWSIHLYQPVPWHLLMMTTLIAGLGASLVRALLPAYWFLPAATLTLGLLLQQL